MDTPIPTPVRYTPALDPVGGDEATLAAEIAETFATIQRQTFVDEGRGLRGVHAKSHGILKATMEVPEGLPETLSQGIFSRPGQFEVLMRFSTSPGDLMSDKVSTPRGLAIKILGVEGKRLEGSEDVTTQDFLFANGPTFPARDAKAFLGSLKLLAATTDKAEGAKRGLSAVLRATESALEAMSGKTTPLVALGGQQPVHPLGETFFSQLPQRFGDYIAKLRLQPFSPDLKALVGMKVDLGESDNVLRDEIIRFFTTNSAIWELGAQLCTDIDDTPINEPAKTWDEKISPFFAIARITVPQQLAWSDQKELEVSDTLGFSPWHGVEAHRPMGSIMRIRKHVYESTQAFRSQHNPLPVAEPEPGSIRFAQG